METEVVARLDRLIGLFELAYSSELNLARAEIRSDEVVAHILDATEDWQPVGFLKSSVAKATGTSEKTVQRRIAELVSKRVLVAEGAAAARRVRASGIA